MEFKLADDGDTTEVRVSGDLDMQSSPQLRKTLLALVARRVGRLVVNLEDVPYVDSSGLATLVECRQGVSQYGGKLELAGVNGHIRPVFELARLDQFFGIRSV
jgi:anti-sigma B factor antagonist